MKTSVIHCLCDGNKFADRLKGKKKNPWKNSSAVEEEDQLKVIHFKILVCGVLTYYSWPPLLIQADVLVLS
jgi:hypothetical protein